MSEHFASGVQLRLASGFRVHWEAALQNYILLYPNGLETLTPLQGEAIRRCDGHHTPGDIMDELHEHFPELDDVRTRVLKDLKDAHARGWLCLPSGY